MPRLEVTKSRNGCIQCKARHVKCDEERPCGNCVKYGANCTLMVSTLHSADKTLSRASSNELIKHKVPTRLIHTSAVVEITPAPVTLSTVSMNGNLHVAYKGDDWVVDLELMHHYTTQTFATFPGSDKARFAWGYKVPQEATGHTYLMHAILCFAAYHLAFLNPESAQKYYSSASNHQAAAMRGLREALLNINGDNCHAVFATACLTVLIAFASTNHGSYPMHGASRAPKADALNRLMDIFHLTRGVGFIVENSSLVVSNGCCATILDNPLENSPPIPLLDKLILELTHYVSSAALYATDVAISAARLLRDVIEICIEYGGYPLFRIVIMWPGIMEAGCLDALRSDQDPALRAVFSKYCTILNRVGKDFWYCEYWADFDYE